MGLWARSVPQPRTSPKACKVQTTAPLSETRFSTEPYTRGERGGGGVARVLQNGNVFEKAGVNLSVACLKSGTLRHGRAWNLFGHFSKKQLNMALVQALCLFGGRRLNSISQEHPVSVWVCGPLSIQVSCVDIQAT